jgi:hypothetical protein
MKIGKEPRGSVSNELRERDFFSQGFVTPREDNSVVFWHLIKKVPTSKAQAAVVQPPAPALVASSVLPVSKLPPITISEEGAEGGLPSPLADGRRSPSSFEKSAAWFSQQGPIGMTPEQKELDKELWKRLETLYPQSPAENCPEQYQDLRPSLLADDKSLSPVEEQSDVDEEQSEWEDERGITPTPDECWTQRHPVLVSGLKIPGGFSSQDNKNRPEQNVPASSDLKVPLAPLAPQLDEKLLKSVVTELVESNEKLSNRMGQCEPTSKALLIELTKKSSLVGYSFRLASSHGQCLYPKKNDYALMTHTFIICRSKDNELIIDPTVSQFFSSGSASPKVFAGNAEEAKDLFRKFAIAKDYTNFKPDLLALAAYGIGACSSFRVYDQPTPPFFDLPGVSFFE